MTPRFFKGLLIATITIAISLWVGTFFLVPHFYPSLDSSGKPATRPISGPGEFGDMFNVANSLFIAMSLIFVVAAMLIESAKRRDDGIQQAEAMKTQRQDITSIAQILENISIIQLQIADALSVQATLLSSRNRREQIKQILEFKNTQLARIPSIFGPGNGAAGLIETARLNEEILQLQNELASI